MKVRRTLAIICYIVSLAAYAAAGYVSFIAWTGEISYKLGFLLFLPIWIITYWFSTFFVQLIERKSGGQTTWLIGKIPRRLLTAFANLLGIILLGFWIYVYIIQYAAAAA